MMMVPVFIASVALGCCIAILIIESHIFNKDVKELKELEAKVFYRLENE